MISRFKINGRKIWNATVCFLLLTTVLFSACQNDIDNSEELETKTGFVLNDGSYHRVVKYVAKNNGDDTFEVREYSQHLFSASNSDYKNRTGTELCDMVLSAAVEASSSYEYTLSADEDQYINYDDYTETFHLYSGLTYKVYYYF